MRDCTIGGCYFTGAHEGVAPSARGRMYTLLLALIMTGFALRADTLTSTSCISGSTTVNPCPGSYLFPGGLPNAMAGADASDNSIIPGTQFNPFLPPISPQLTMSTGATAVATGSNTANSVSAYASAFGTFISAGPPSVGSIIFNISLSQLHGGDSSVSISDGVHTYSYDAFTGTGSTPPFDARCFEGCDWTATVPFDLGVPFTVTVISEDLESTSAGSSLVAHGNTSADLEFRLKDGGSGLVPFSEVPEPSTCALLLLGSAFAFASWSKRSRETH